MNDGCHCTRYEMCVNCRAEMETKPPKKKSFFPVMIYLPDGDKYEIHQTPDTLPVGVNFRVQAKNVKIFSGPFRV